MMKIFGAGVAASLLLTVPPWPQLNRHPLTWLRKTDALPAAATASGALEPAPAVKGAAQGKARKRRATVAMVKPSARSLATPENEIRSVA
jgi:hypothetical protein